MNTSRLKIVTVIITLIFCSVQTISAYNSPNFKLHSRAVLPTKYYLHISTIIHQKIFTYNGSVRIDLEVREPTNEIVLNSKLLRNLDITLISRRTGLSIQGHQIKFDLDEEKEQLRISWPLYSFSLQPGHPYGLQINFVGNIQQHAIRGFFDASNLDDGNENYITQFEPTNARLAFPCFDEPNFKAKFVIRVTHSPKYTPISNMPVDGEPVFSSTSNGPMITTTFQETPPMSTQNVGFAISNYKHTTIVANGGIEYRSFYPPNSKNYGSRGFENTIKTIDVLEKILGIKYPLPKLDQIQVKKYGLGNQNWGLMIFSEDQYLSNQVHYEKFELLDFIIIHNQKIALQWFGDLVTPASWKYIWLKEGISTYFGILAADLVYPEEKIFEYFLRSVHGRLDAYNLNHSLTRDIEEGCDIKEQYNLIPYVFGPNFFRMVHHAVGKNTFMKGIYKYLTEFKYSVADEDQFFGALQSAVDEDEVYLFQNNQSVANVFHTWTHNVAWPTIIIIRNYETGTVTIRQESVKSENKDQKWWIPINFATASHPEFEQTFADYIMPPQAEVTLDLRDLNISLSRNDWLIVNKQGTGSFYVLYDDHNLKLITEALYSNQQIIHPSNRALIFRDLYLTFDSKINSRELVQELLQYMQFEEEPLPWMEAIDLIYETHSSISEVNSTLHDLFTGMLFELQSVPEGNCTWTEQAVVENNINYSSNDTLDRYFIQD